MRLATLLGPDLKALLEDPAALREAFEDFHAEDVAELLDDLPEEQVVELLDALPIDIGADVLERLSADRQRIVLRRTERPTELLTEMDPDDRADILDELEEPEAQALLEQLEPEIIEETQELLGYENDTAGGIMTTEYARLEPELGAGAAIEELRRLAREGEAETIYHIYVVGYGKLVGVVSLRELILADTETPIAEIMTEKVVSVSPADDQEEVARIIARYDLTAVPVVNDHGEMLGVVTIDDVVDVVIDEATEDAQKMGGVVPLEESYFDTGIVEFVWKRGAWLVVLFLGQLLTATVIEKNQDALAATMELALFIPLIIASGGNAGSQSATLIIRAMAVGEAKPKDWLRVFGRELLVGLALGLALGCMGFGRAWFAGESVSAFGLAFAVGSSILAIVTLSTVIGSLLPMLIRRLGLDPAVSSTPFIASVVDVLGLIVYFTVAQLILHSVF